MNLQIQFPIHQTERTQDTTSFVKENEVRLSGNCKKIMQHFQKQNIPLTDDAARLWLNVKSLAQRIADLRLNGVVILDSWVKVDNKRAHKSYSLGCQCPEPRYDVTGCYLHDLKLKIQ